LFLKGAQTPTTKSSGGIHPGHEQHEVTIQREEAQESNKEFEHSKPTWIRKRGLV
jgi:hypothetical protein